MYYLRTKPAADAIQFTVNKAKAAKSSEIGLQKLIAGVKEKEPELPEDLYLRKLTCSLQNKEDCMMCGS